ncbi:helix-turn-helix transcriptional regulator [Rhizobium sp. FY34]|uniref:helix-turn-helix transcriptional regulator n=1 Tax=Rhizobium sp. FY34 TaxID=2562309 RepID=UPI0010BFC980|nr:helix-turn-helix transcriptional regulator [Rhizobium sp. FY34]
MLENRRTLAERARCGQLRLPGGVAELRKGIGMSQDEFAKVIGLTRRQIAEIEAGTANPTLETMKKIGRLFGFDVGFVAKEAG